MKDINETLAEVNDLIKEGEELVQALSTGPVMKVVQTDTIKAKFASLPIEDLSVRFLVEVLEPVQLVPRIMAITHSLTQLSGKLPTDILKEVLLKEWHDHFKNEITVELPPWISQVDKVQLIECDLLVPKVQS